SPRRELRRAGAPGKTRYRECPSGESACWQLPGVSPRTQSGAVLFHERIAATDHAARTDGKRSAMIPLKIARSTIDTFSCELSMFQSAKRCGVDLADTKSRRQRPLENTGMRNLSHLTL